jgi:predicted metal-dependent phosphoesterase TrpH
LSFKVDLHTHSYGSPDGGLRLRDYHYFFSNGLLDYAAITDHDQISVALKIQKELGPLAERIIVGEEVATTEGELIGLFLTERIEPGLSPLETAQAIHDQGGIVYVPHPFETVRSGLPETALDAIAKQVDIVETRNGRAIFQNRGERAEQWALARKLPGAASSDAHGRFGWGYTYSVIVVAPTSMNIVDELGRAAYSRRTVGWGIIYPKLNRLKKRLKG